MDENRREKRYPARIVARVVRRGERIELLTNDVSFRGAFLRTDTPPALRQLVQVEFVLPSGEKIAAHAMIVHAEGRGEHGEGVPGVGLQFYGPIGQAKAWEQFVFDLKMKERSGALSSRATDKVRRASERFKLALEVVLGGKQLVTRDVSINGMAIRTDLAMPVGTRAELTVKAPSREPLVLDVVVRRIIDEPGFKGLGVEFLETTQAARTELVAFVRANAPEDPNAVYVDPDDPGLH